jgi:hypothetical protein
MFKNTSDYLRPFFKSYNEMNPSWLLSKPSKASI